MNASLLYRVARVVARFATTIYFKKLEISGAELIPPTGPVILAANHPQSATDAIVLGLGAGRMVHYLAKSVVFDNPWQARLLHNLGVIPVHRHQDVEDAATKNVGMFSACESLLEGGGAIGIFPEGISAEARRVHKLKTGAARIALQTEEKNAWTLGITIVPVGLSFESRQLMRSRVLVRFGAPIIASDYRASYETDPIEAVYALTTDLQQALGGLVVNIERPEFEQLVQDIERVYKAELIERSGAVTGASRFETDQALSVEISKALRFFLQKDPEVVLQIGSMLQDYHRKLDRMRLRDDELRDDKKRTVRREAAVLVVLGVVGLPLAVYGAVCNYLPYKLTGWLARRKSENTTQVHHAQIAHGSWIYGVYYTALFYIAYRIAGPVAAVFFGATLPPTGIFARAYIRYLVRRERLLRLAYLRLTQRYYVDKIKRQRELLISRLDRALADYVSENPTNT